jgi:DNA-binding NarL/FixJ family response regulator
VLSPVDSALRARLLAVLVTADTWDVPDNAEPRSAEALAMAERVGDHRALREALRARQMALSGPDGVRDRLALGDRLVSLGRELSRERGADSVEADDAVLWGRLWRFLIDQVAQRLRSPLAGWHAARCRAAVAAARGQLAEALDHALEAERAGLRAATDGVHVPTQGLLVAIRLMSGDPDPSPRVLASAPGHVTAFLRAVHTNWLLRRGRRDEAERLYRTLPSLEVPPFVQLSAWAGMAELAAEFDDRGTAARMYEHMRPYADLFVCSGAGVIVMPGTVRLPLGIAAATAGRLDDAVRHLRAAIASGESTRMPPVVAQATYRLARVLARRTRPGDRDEAVALAAAAASLAGRIGMLPLHQEAEAFAGTLTAAGAGPLTRREREIAELVGQGLSNRQIAAASHISERTVESHVQHILDKLGFHNRAQVAAWVAAAGQAGSEIRTGPA